MKAKMEEAKKRGFRERGPFTKDVTPGGGTPPKPKSMPPKPTPPTGSGPVRVMPGKKPMRVTGGMGMKSGGMVKGKKK
jgi:hypothetical protein